MRNGRAMTLCYNIRGIDALLDRPFPHIAYPYASFCRSHVICALGSLLYALQSRDTISVPH